MKRIWLILLAVCVMLTLNACRDYTEDVLEIAMIAENGDLSALDMYPNLQYVDLRGSTCYDEIIRYAQSHPEVKVRYHVDLGNEQFDHDATEISLTPSDFQYDVLLQNLKYLPELKELTLIHTELTLEQIQALSAAFPDITIHYDVLFHREPLSDSVTEADFSFLAPEEVSEAVNVISMLPHLTDVQLMRESGNTNLSIADVKMLTEAYPNVNFHYDFKLFGQSVSTMDGELIFDEVNIGNEGVAQIRDALDIMPHCNFVKLDTCKIDDEVMAQLRDDYPDKEIVWRVFINRYSLLTNEEMVRMYSKVTNKNAEPLKYCTKVKYLDLYYNSLSDFSFIANMPDLECAILTLTNISDLTPFTNCQNLIWLELSNCGKIRDISCLSQLPNLKYLNISQTKISDISALENLPLERFVCSKSKVSADDVEAFIAKHPACLTVSKGSTLGYGWRYDDDKQTPFSYYSKIAEIFRYDEKGYYGNRKEK